MPHVLQISEARLMEAGLACKWVKRKVCTRLNISRPTLDLWIAKLRIDWPVCLRSQGGIYLAGGKDSQGVKYTSNYSKEMDGAPLPFAAHGRKLASMAASETIEEPREVVSMRMRQSIWKRIRHAAIDSDVPAAVLVETAVAHYLDVQTKADKAEQAPTKRKGKE